MTAELPDRIAGTIIGMAADDALGAGHEFARPPRPRQAAMIGGGLGDWEPGAWTLTFASRDVDRVGGRH